MSLPSSITAPETTFIQLSILAASGSATLTTITTITTTITPASTATFTTITTFTSSILPPGTIAGIAIGGVFAGTLIFFLIGCLFSRLRARKQCIRNHDSDDSTDYSFQPHGGESTMVGRSSNKIAAYDAFPARNAYPKMQTPGAGARIDPSSIGLAVGSPAPAPGWEPTERVKRVSSSSLSKMLPPRPLDEVVRRKPVASEQVVKRWTDGGESGWTVFEEDIAVGGSPDMAKIYVPGSRTSSFRPEGNTISATLPEKLRIATNEAVIRRQTTAPTPPSSIYTSATTMSPLYPSYLPSYYTTRHSLFTSPLPSSPLSAHPNPNHNRSPTFLSITSFKEAAPPPLKDAPIPSTPKSSRESTSSTSFESFNSAQNTSPSEVDFADLYTEANVGNRARSHVGTVNFSDERRRLCGKATMLISAESEVMLKVRYPKIPRPANLAVSRKVLKEGNGSGNGNSSFDAGGVGNESKVFLLKDVNDMGKWGGIGGLDVMEAQKERDSAMRSVLRESISVWQPRLTPTRRGGEMILEVV